MKNHSGNILWKSKKSSVINCKTCGFAHVKPIPKLEKLEKMYVHKFYQNLKPDYIKKDESELPYWNITFDDKLDIIEKFVNKKHKKILDIGCGGGFFLNRAKERNWKVLGIEPSPLAAKYARKNGIEIVESTFEKFLEEKPMKFDAIHSKFFLEHVIDPLRVCKTCFKMLNKGGIICFEVPNDFSTLQKVVVEKLNKKKYWVGIPEHVNYFTPISLQNLFKKNGFKIIYVESTFPLEFFLMFGLDYLSDDKIGKKIHKMRMKFEETLQESGNNNLKRELYEYFSKKGLGREIIVYAQKK